MEQLQAKELELLQLKTELETSQGPEKERRRARFLYHYSPQQFVTLSGIELSFLNFSKSKETQGRTSVIVFDKILYPISKNPV